MEEQRQYGEYWQELMETIVASQLEIDDRPCFELYHSYDEQMGVADVSFCTAIKV